MSLNSSFGLSAQGTILVDLSSRLKLPREFDIRLIDDGGLHLGPSSWQREQHLVRARRLRGSPSRFETYNAWTNDIELNKPIALEIPSVEHREWISWSESRDSDQPPQEVYERTLGPTLVALMLMAAAGAGAYYIYDQSVLSAQREKKIIEKDRAIAVAIEAIERAKEENRLAHSQLENRRASYDRDKAALSNDQQQWRIRRAQEEAALSESRRLQETAMSSLRQEHQMRLKEFQRRNEDLERKLKAALEQLDQRSEYLDDEEVTPRYDFRRRNQYPR